MIERPPQILSDCETYEYEFRRTWDATLPVALWIMLNPSFIQPEPGDLPTRADGPTVFRCVTFSKQLGCGGLVTGNIFAHRATRPEELTRCADPVGPENDATLHRLLKEAKFVVAAWGGSYPLRYTRRVHEVTELLRAKGSYCLGKTKSGQPRHPLYVPGATHLVPL